MIRTIFDCFENHWFTNDFDRDALIAFLLEMSKKKIARQTSDDGFSQKTTVKRGIASSAEELVPGSQSHALSNIHWN